MAVPDHLTDLTDGRRYDDWLAKWARRRKHPITREADMMAFYAARLRRLKHRYNHRIAEGHPCR